MKVYVTDEKELIMEPSLKWAGNPDITVAVKAFGLKATVQVSDLSPCKGNISSIKTNLQSFSSYLWWC